LWCSAGPPEREDAGPELEAAIAPSSDRVSCRARSRRRSGPARAQVSRVQRVASPSPRTTSSTRSTSRAPRAPCASMEIIIIWDHLSTNVQPPRGHDVDPDVP
jgi:hypothetical protein